MQGRKQSTKLMLDSTKLQSEKGNHIQTRRFDSKKARFYSPNFRYQVMVGLGKLSSSDVSNLLQTSHRVGGLTAYKAPAAGLCLDRCFYSPEALQQHVNHDVSGAAAR